MYTLATQAKTKESGVSRDRPLRNVAGGEGQTAIFEKDGLPQLKKRYPTWGAPKIREKLRPLCAPVRCPAVSTIHAVLDRNGSCGGVRRRPSRRTGTPLSTATEPNALWCADFKGQFLLEDRRYCYPLTITDFASRYLLGLGAREN